MLRRCHREALVLEEGDRRGLGLAREVGRDLHERRPVGHQQRDGVALGDAPPGRRTAAEHLARLGAVTPQVLGVHLEAERRELPGGRGLGGSQCGDRVRGGAVGQHREGGARRRGHEQQGAEHDPQHPAAAGPAVVLLRRLCRGDRRCRTGGRRFGTGRRAGSGGGAASVGAFAGAGLVVVLERGVVDLRGLGVGGRGGRVAAPAAAAAKRGGDGRRAGPGVLDGDDRHGIGLEQHRTLRRAHRWSHPPRAGAGRGRGPRGNTMSVGRGYRRPARGRRRWPRPGAGHRGAAACRRRPSARWRARPRRGARRGRCGRPARAARAAGPSSAGTSRAGRRGP